VNELEKPIPITHQSQLLNNPYLGLPLQVGDAIEECEGMLVSRNLFCAILHWTITFRFPNGCKWKQVLWSYSLFILHGMMSENLFLEKKRKDIAKNSFRDSAHSSLCCVPLMEIKFIFWWLIPRSLRIHWAAHAHLPPEPCHRAEPDTQLNMPEMPQDQEQKGTTAKTMLKHIISICDKPYYIVIANTCFCT
jgi:hypothetical protein